MSSISTHSVSNLIKLIDEMATKNQQTIDRINARLNESVLCFNYVVHFSSDSTTQNPRFRVEQQQQSTRAKSVINNWRNKEIKLIIISDIFNDKINFDCSTFNDISRLNTTMLPVVHKYELFGETEKAYEEVNKFYENFQILQTLLMDLEQMFNTPESQLSQLNERFDNITNELNDLRTKFGSKIRYQYNFPPR